MVAKLDDRCRVEVVELFHRKHDLVPVFYVAGCVRVLCWFDPYEPRDEEWTQQTHQYLRVAQTA